jgi:hypothetical protein
MRQAILAKLYVKKLKRLLRYFNGTRTMGITYGRPSLEKANDIKAFSGSKLRATDTTA